MPREDYQVLLNEMQQYQSNSQEYAPFLTAMQQLNQEMEGLMEPDENGWKLITPERMDSLAGKYRTAGRALEKYLQGTKNTTDPLERANREKAEKLAEILAADTAAFRRYNPRDPENQKSLPTILDEARVQTIDISDVKIKSVGGAQSQRMPMTIVGPDGNPMEGFFTKAEVYDPLGTFNKVADSAAEKAATPDGRALLSNFMNAYKEYYTQHPDKNKSVKTNPEMVVGFLMNSRKDPNKGMALSQDKIVSEIAKVSGKTPEEVKNLCGKNALKGMTSGLEKIFFDVQIKGREVGMTDKTRIDKKNAGMSIVAELIGVQNVVCYSKPMKIRTKDGREIEGTFMAKAKGEDPNSAGRKGILVNSNSLKNTDGRGLEAIADLQALDYICGNIDRHAGNLFYQFDDDGKLIGVQGIDNDSSFGTFAPQKANDRIRCQQVPVTMGAISKKTAQRILDLSPEELAFSLRGTIDEESIKAACDRLYIMQHVIKRSRQDLNPDEDTIKYPSIRELDTEGFRRLAEERSRKKAETNLDKLTSSRNHNLFCEVKRGFDIVRRYAKVENDEKKKAKLLGSTDRATDAGITGQILHANNMKKMLSDRTSFFRGKSSPNYQRVEEAVQEYYELTQKIRDRMAESRKKVQNGDKSPETVFGQYVTPQDLRKMQKSLKKMEQAADVYAAGKLKELRDNGKTIDSDTYIKLRIEGVQEISKFAKEGQKLSESERKTLENNDRHALEDYTRLQGKEKKNPDPEVQIGLN